MSAFSESNSERPVVPPHDQAEEDIRRRAECAEKISRLLSALDGGSSTGKTQYLTKEVIRKTNSNPDSDTATRFLVIGRNGPLGEFKSWEDACQYRNDLQQHGASIIGVEKNPLELGAVREKMANQQANPPAAQQANPPAAQQANPPAAQQANPPAAQQANPPPAQQANPPAAQQANPPAAQQANPQAAQQANPPPAQQANPPAAQQANPPAAQQANPPAAQQANPPPAQQANPPAAQQANPPAAQQANPPAAQQANPPPAQQANPPANPPARITGGLNSPNRSSIQELKKADDPGDSRPNSLPQAGTFPANSTVMRIVGKIFPVAAKTVTLNACPQILSNRYELLVLGNSDEQITNVTLTCAPPAPDYGTININYTAELTKAANRA